MHSMPTKSESNESSTKLSPPSPWISNYYDALLHPSKPEEIERESSQMSHSSGFNPRASRFSYWLSKMTVVAALCGIAIGFLMRVRGEPYTQREIMYASILSNCLNSSLRCIFVPLLVSNVFLTLSQLNFKLCTRISRRACFFFLCSNVSGTAIGIVMAVILNPGVKARGRAYEPTHASNMTIIESFLYTVINTVTMNILPASMFQSSASEMREYSGIRSLSVKQTIYDLVPSTNFSGLLFLTFVYGLCASRVQNQLKFLPLLTETFCELSILVVKLIAILAPFGILSSMITIVLKIPPWENFLSYLDLYFIAIIGGILIHLLVFMNLIHFLLAGRVRCGLFFSVMDIVSLATCVPSGLYAVPFTMAFLHDRTSIDHRVATLVVPLAAGYHKPATAVFYAVAPIFVAQASGSDLGLIDIIRLACLSYFCTIAESGFPGASTVFVQGAVQFIGADSSSIALILPIQFIVNVFTNACDVFCDCLCANAVHTKMKVDIRNQDRIRRSLTETCHLFSMAGDYGCLEVIETIFNNSFNLVEL